MCVREVVACKTQSLPAASGYQNARMNVAAEIEKIIAGVIITRFLIVHETKPAHQQLFIKQPDVCTIVNVGMQYVVIAFYQKNIQPLKIIAPAYKELDFFIRHAVKHVAGYDQLFYIVLLNEAK